MKSSYVTFACVFCVVAFSRGDPVVAQTLLIDPGHVLQWPKAVRVYDGVERGGEKFQVRLETHPSSLHTCREIDGQVLFADCRGQIFQWEPEALRLKLLGKVELSALSGICKCPTTGTLLISCKTGKIARMRFDGETLDAVETGQNISAIERVGSRVVIGTLNGNLMTLTSTFKPSGQECRIGLGIVQSIEASPDGTILCVGSSDTPKVHLTVHSGKTLRLHWKTSAMEVPRSGSHISYVKKITLTGDNEYVALLGSTGIARCWNIASQEEVRLSGMSHASDIRFDEDRQLFLADLEGRLERIVLPRDAKASK